MNETQGDCSYAACIVRFKAIDDKLNAIHADFARLEQRVMNGMTDRLNQVEKHVTLLGVERDKKDKRAARWETAIISVIVSGAVLLGSFLVTQYVRHQDQQQQQQLKKP